MICNFEESTQPQNRHRQKGVVSLGCVNPPRVRNHANYGPSFFKTILVFVSVPVEEPNFGAASECHEDVFLFRADVALLVPLPAEVPLLLAALRDGVAVHGALQVGVHTE